MEGRMRGGHDSVRDIKDARRRGRGKAVYEDAQRFATKSMGG